MSFIKKILILFLAIFAFFNTYAQNCFDLDFISSSGSNCLTSGDDVTISANITGFDFWTITDPSGTIVVGPNHFGLGTGLDLQ